MTPNTAPVETVLKPEKDQTTKCSRCHCFKPVADFVGKRKQVKTCVRCRDTNKKPPTAERKAKLAGYSRAFRKANPAYDKRDRRAYNAERKKKNIISTTVEPVTNLNIPNEAD